MSVGPYLNGTAPKFGTFDEIGRSGVPIFSGIVFDEPLNELKGERRKRVIRQMMMNDPVIGALLFTIKMIIRQVTWRIDAASSSSADEATADFVRGALFEDMTASWADTLSDIVTFLPWGWSLSELCYRRRSGDNRDPTLVSRFNDNKIGWRDWPIRSQETLFSWVLDDASTLVAMVQVAPPDYAFRTIPLEKAVHFKTESNRGNPEGYSILRNCYRPWRMKTRIENLEGIGIERDLAGLPVVYMPAEYMSDGATAVQKQVYEYAKTLVTSIRNDEQGGVVMPMAYNEAGHKMFELSLLSSGGTRKFNTDQTINRLDHRILASVLADFLLLGAEKVGSFALSSDKTELFGIALGAWLDAIAGVVNQGPIPRLLRLNGIPLETIPRLAHENVNVPDISELADAVARLVSAKALTPDPGLETYIRQAAGFPELPEEDVVSAADRLAPPAVVPPQQQQLPDATKPGDQGAAQPSPNK